MSIKISEEFTDVLLFEPYKISKLELFKVFKDVLGKNGALGFELFEFLKKHPIIDAGWIGNGL